MTNPFIGCIFVKQYKQGTNHITEGSLLKRSKEMKTRLEKQIEKMQNELDATVNFANEQHAIFMKDFNSKIAGILKSYKLEVINPSDNTFVDKMIGGGDFLYRVYLQVDLSKLSDRQQKNLEKKLREAKVPMPACAFSFGSISLVYGCK